MENNLPLTKEQSLSLKKAMYASVPKELYPKLDKLYSYLNYQNYSPVKRFEKAAGISGIYYQYKMPNNMDPLEYEALMKPMRIYEMIERGLSDNMEPLIEALEEQKPHNLFAVRKMYEALVELNPELQQAKISPAQIKSYVVVISGACSGFPPEDIINFSYCENKNRLNEEKRQFSRLLEQRLQTRGPDNTPLIENWCPSESTRQKIMKELKPRFQNKAYFSFLKKRGWYDD